MKINGMAFGTILKVIKNKYFIALVAFLAWITFFDRDNILTRREMNQNLDDLRREKQFYIDEIAKDKKSIEDLNHDSPALEKIGRENYLMKKDSEDVYLVVKQEPKED